MKRPIATAFLAEDTTRSATEARTATRPATTTGPAILRPKDVRALLAAPDRRGRQGKRDAALLAVLVGSGCRSCEATRLCVDHVEFTGGRCRLTIRTAKQRAGSPPKWRTCTLPPAAARLLHDWLVYAQPKLFVFEGRRHEALSTRAVRTTVTKYLRQIGRTDMRTHGLRHTVGAALARGSGNMWLVAKTLGHSSPATAYRFYSQYSLEDSDKVSDILAGLWSPRQYNKGGAK